VVRETVPDSVFERADQVELVDLPPEELLKRLQEGKVYVPEISRRPRTPTRSSMPPCRRQPHPLRLPEPGPLAME
jgi:hypothetical protein